MNSPMAPGFLFALLLIGACALGVARDEARDAAPVVVVR